MEADDAGGERGPEQPWVIPTEYEAGGRAWFADAVGEMQRAMHPLLAGIPRVETPDMPQLPAAGEPVPAEASPFYRPMTTSHVWTVNVEDVVNFRVEQFLHDLVEMADATGGQQVRDFLEMVSDFSEDAGNVVSANGRDFIDVYIEMLETMEISFDDDGRPQHTIVLHPDELARLRENPPTPEQEAMIDAVLKRRWEEWRAARRRRDLP